MSTTTTQDNATIEGTVRQTLTARNQGSYMTYAQPVIEALTTRERTISESLLEFASEKGAQESEVKEFLAGLGLALPVEEVEEADDDSDEDSTDRILNAIAGLGERVDNLERLARSHGLR